MAKHRFGPHKVSAWTFTVVHTIWFSMLGTIGVRLTYTSDPAIHRILWDIALGYIALTLIITTLWVITWRPPGQGRHNQGHGRSSLRDLIWAKMVALEKSSPTVLFE